MGFYPTDTHSSYESKGNTKIDIYEIDLGLGLSYRFFSWTCSSIEYTVHSKS